MSVKRTALELIFKKCVKRRESGNYLGLERELKKLWNMKITMIQIVIGALGTVSKGLEKRFEDMEIIEKFKLIQTITLLNSARILSRYIDVGRNLSLRFKRKTTN